MTPFTEVAVDEIVDECLDTSSAWEYFAGYLRGDYSLNEFSQKMEHEMNRAEERLVKARTAKEQYYED